MLKYILCLEGCFILSDKGYRCSKFSISPFFKNEKDESLTDEECRHYDEVHRITRSSIERAIGKLKARVPLLSKGVNRKTPADIVDFVNAAVTFHQLCRYIELALNYGIHTPPRRSPRMRKIGFSKVRRRKNHSWRWSDLWNSTFSYLFVVDSFL